MVDTTFVDESTVIVSAWLQDVNDLVYKAFASGATASAFTINATPTQVSTDAGATVGPTYILYRNSASPAANDALGSLRWDGNNSSAVSYQYGYVTLQAEDVTAGSEDAGVLWYISTAGSLGACLALRATQTIVGKGASAGSSSVGVGNTAAAGGSSATAVGHTSTASALSSTAVGKSATASAASATALGASAGASQSTTLAVGESSQASAVSSTAVGAGASATQTGSVSLGQGAASSGAASIAIGYNADATASGAIAIGGHATDATSANSSAANSIAIGNGVTVSGANSVGVGDTITLTGQYEVILGYQASGSSSATGGIAIGYQAAGTSLGGTQQAIAIGWSANCNGRGVAIGQSANATGNSGVCVGDSSAAAGTGGAAFGSSASASGTAATALGNAVTAGHLAAVAIGYQASTGAIGQYMHSTGRFASNGDANYTRFICRGSTTNASATNINPDGGTTNRMIIPASTLWGFKIYLTVRENATGDSKFVEYAGGIRRDGANNTALVTGGITTVRTIEDAGAAGWSVAITADDTNEALQIAVTGEASHTLRWVAVVDIVAVSG